MIAKARYIYHEARNKVLTEKRKRPDIQLTINELKHKMKIMEEQ